MLSIGFRTALSRIGTYVRANLAADRLTAIETTLRYWATRTVPNSPTTVLELDEDWSKQVRQELGALP